MGGNYPYEVPIRIYAYYLTQFCIARLFFPILLSSCILLSPAMLNSFGTYDFTYWVFLNYLNDFLDLISVAIYIHTLHNFNNDQMDLSTGTYWRIESIKSK